MGKEECESCRTVASRLEVAVRDEVDVAVLGGASRSEERVGRKL